MTRWLFDLKSVVNNGCHKSASHASKYPDLPLRTAFHYLIVRLPLHLADFQQTSFFDNEIHPSSFRRSSSSKPISPRIVWSWPWLWHTRVTNKAHIRETAFLPDVQRNCVRYRIKVGLTLERRRFQALCERRRESWFRSKISFKNERFNEQTCFDSWTSMFQSCSHFSKQNRFLTFEENV